MFLRTFRTGDLEALIDLTVRAFEPIQNGIRQQLGDELFARQNGQWRQDYRDTLVELTGPGNQHRFLVADLDGTPAGYAAWSTHPGPAGPQGEITLLAVDPGHQRTGLGRALIDEACAAIRAAGCVVAWASTGGDEAHTSARAAYATAGFTPLPTVFYSRVL
ncbi:GNAT family N-acetyltransferase [Kocuria rosea]|uniref:GNAT family N-acetyltransferase n=1 Tax=Kocuria rosea TaxID=1275 RepID=UPI00203AEDAC|nr:GNAT family N-acetyltransferase [Kocuria rosea]MCM3688683.1 GNAT family N-acetyltransferase [Kocuria rosea]